MPFQTRWEVNGELIVTVASGEITVDAINQTTQKVVGMMDAHPHKSIGWIIYCPTQPRIPYDIAPMMSNARFAMATNNLAYCVILGRMSGVLLATVQLLARLLPKLSYCATEDELRVLLKVRAPSAVFQPDDVVTKGTNHPPAPAER